jgi:hypothetical protein
MSPIDSGERYVKYGLSEEGMLFLFNPKKASFMHSSCSRMGHRVFKIKGSCTKTERNNNLADNFWLWVDHH